MHYKFVCLFDWGGGGGGGARSDFACSIKSLECNLQTRSGSGY